MRRGDIGGWEFQPVKEALVVRRSKADRRCVSDAKQGCLAEVFPFVRGCFVRRR